LGALDQLSQSHSVIDIGINTLLAHAGVAKASLYTHFGSKDELIAAWLDERQERWFGWFYAHLAAHAPSGEPAHEIDAAFGFLEAW
jgi:AcrR family transcriptional regulator